MRDQGFRSAARVKSSNDINDSAIMIIVIMSLCLEYPD